MYRTCLLNCRVHGQKDGQRGLKQQRLCVNKRCLLSIIFDLCICVVQPIVFLLSKWQQKPTWKCRCIDYLRCGIAHSRGCEEDDQGQGQQTSCPGWLAALCELPVYPKALCPVIVLPHWVDFPSFPSPCTRTWKREISKILCPS